MGSLQRSHVQPLSPHNVEGRWGQRTHRWVSSSFVLSVIPVVSICKTASHGGFCTSCRLINSYLKYVCYLNLDSYKQQIRKPGNMSAQHCRWPKCYKHEAASTGHTVINPYAEADLMKCRSQHTGCSSLSPYYLILQKLPMTVTATKLLPICRLFGRTLEQQENFSPN